MMLSTFEPLKKGGGYTANSLSGLGSLAFV